MEYASILQKIAAIAADFDQAFFNPDKVYTGVMTLGPVKLTLKDLKLSAVSKSEDPLCNGPVMQSDRFYAWTQLECCSLSDQDVNEKCANSSCPECCQLNECDWSGLLEGFIGYCETTGIACTE